METLSSTPYAQLASLRGEGGNSNVYDVQLLTDLWRSRDNEPHNTSKGDFLILSHFKPQTVNELKDLEQIWSFAEVLEEDMNVSSFKILTFRNIKLNKIGPESPLFITFLTNITTNKRIWKSLHMKTSSELIRKVLCAGDMALQIAAPTDESLSSSELNESQKEAISACLASIKLEPQSATVDLIRGPPGTGKTKTLATLLYILNKKNLRTLVCAPNDIAIKEVAACLLSIMKKNAETSLCQSGGILYFGSNECVRDGEPIEELDLNYRVKELSRCFAPSNGWNVCVSSMTKFFENPLSDYHQLIELTKCSKSFLEFVRESFCETANQLRSYICILQAHMARSYIGDLDRLSCSLDSFEGLFHNSNIDSEVLKEIFSKLAPHSSSSVESSQGAGNLLNKKRTECLSSLKTLQDLLGELHWPNEESINEESINEESIKAFCFRSSSLLFCTASSSFDLHSVDMNPLNILVIDEAAQLKECESIIPLLLPHINHAILSGDECQLPAVVESKLSLEVGFGRSLFERLKLLNHPLHRLNRQYRMHFDISSFPNSRFYSNEICDGSKVMRTQHPKGSMFKAYSFINLVYGREELDETGRSYKNMVEVEVVRNIIRKYFKEWKAHRSEEGESLSIGVVSPYAAQVVAIKDVLGKEYDWKNGLVVKVKTIEGFQGGEEDCIILSTVRTSSSVEFMSIDRRINVALTRARNNLWILGNERTLGSQESVWKDLVHDAKNRGCFFHADDDKDLVKGISDKQRKQAPLEDCLFANSVYFRNFRWKVIFTPQFLESFKKLEQNRVQNSVFQLLLRLTDGWRSKMKEADARNMIKKFKVEKMILICSNEIVITQRSYIQVLKVWDIQPPDRIPELEKNLNDTFESYTDDYKRRCTERRLHDDQITEVPISWDKSRTDLEKLKRTDAVMTAKAKFDESYYFSADVVRKLLDINRNKFDLPSKLSQEEQKVISSLKSTLVLGRSGTGKTTALTTKLVQMEKILQSSDPRDPFLRQLFVTASPRLCRNIKNQIQLERSIYRSNYDLPDHFNGVPEDAYPLVVTFEKFLRMLDGTIGISYFQRFRDLSSPHLDTASLDSIMRRKEVTFERFCSTYWPHFNSEVTKTLDPFRVYSQIHTYIKGGADGEITVEDYALKNNRASRLTEENRRMIFDIYKAYEKLKKSLSEFDLADVVNDLHKRLKTKVYEGDVMRFTYIDEVQDLTLNQIHLFKYVCPHCEDGFSFCGDTVQTISRGIDFRFEDIRSLFYNKFVEVGESSRSYHKQAIPEIVFLSENFRTHDRVLRFSQSITDLLYHYFPNSMDSLKTEVSSTLGEVPIVLRCEQNKNAMEVLFGSQGGNGFGAHQVVLVRDDSTKEKFSKHVGNRKDTLVLTISEVKGLEFEDVLLYNFFGSSPFEHQWRVIYEFMQEQDMLHSPSPKFPRFDHSKHAILCDELKQLYVAVTRTRQRLWILESNQGFGKPMFDFWREKGLVEFKDLDDTFVQEMKAESSKEEWKSRGEELYDQKNYETAAICFEKAEDSEWGKKSIASSLWETANRLGDVDRDEANRVLRKAAEIFEEIGMDDTAVECLRDMGGEFDEAGQLEEWMKEVMRNPETNVEDMIAKVSALTRSVERRFMSEKELKLREKQAHSTLLYYTGKRTRRRPEDERPIVRAGLIPEMADQSQATSAGQGSTSKKKSKKGISKGRRKGLAVNM